MLLSRQRQLPTLSGGEQQRAHFALVLVQLAGGEALHGPGLLLLDEPTSSLDMRHQINLVETASNARQTARPSSRCFTILILPCASPTGSSCVTTAGWPSMAAPAKR
jgi:ABC-type hemin transport system ATPase subunit